ncbi:MAG: hypothetical protein QOD94_2350 [Alphaproteobacteria bacterium]|nr:hypothetical protein [Alphaproteobacteria bacterium]
MGTVVRALVRGGILAGAVIGLSGCANFHPLQDEKEVIIRSGSSDSAQARRPLLAKDYAGHYVRYAIFALRAYDEKGSETRWKKLPPSAKIWIAGWHPEPPVEGPLPCPDGAPCGLRLPGIGYQVWRRNDCKEIVIAFRGTEFERLDDWMSNLHWITRPLPIRDQYQQVRDNIEDIVNRAKQRCAGTPTIVAVGHSLGGGLAQQASYADKRIRYVYAFDPSFVTGYSDTLEQSRANSKGHKIDRVYEHGEILAYPRFVLRHFAPPRACDPQIRTVRFNVLTGFTFVQHDMVAVTAKLINHAGMPPAWYAKRHPPTTNSREIDPKTGRCRPGADSGLEY